MTKERWYVIATFYDEKGKKVAKSYLTHDLFMNASFTAFKKDAWCALKETDAQKMRNKMSVSKSLYFDPISGKTYPASWSTEVHFEESDVRGDAFKVI